MAGAEQYKMWLSREEEKALQAAAAIWWREADRLLHVAIDARDWHSARCMAKNMACALRLLHEGAGSISPLHEGSVESLLVIEDLFPFVPDSMRDALEGKRRKLKFTYPVEAPAIALFKVSANDIDRLRDQLLIQLTNQDIVGLLLEEKRWDLLPIRAQEFADYLALLAEIGFEAKDGEQKVALPIGSFHRCLRHLIEHLDASIAIWTDITREAQDDSRRLHDDRVALNALASQSPIIR